MRRVALFAISVLVACGGVPGCARSVDDTCSDAAAYAPFTTTLAFVDESGAPVPASIAAATPLVTPLVASAGDHATVGPEPGPVVLIARAAGYFAEPVVVGPEDDGRTVTVRLLSTHGGARMAMTSVGDVMLGRRYEAPDGEDAVAVIPPDRLASASRAVVDGVRDAFGTADVRTLNLETVVSDRAGAVVYPGKRFILRTPPDALAAIEALSPTVVGLANNHQRDFLDDGVADTLAALDQHRIAHLGASATDGTTPSFGIAVGATRLGVLAYTSVDGDFVNDSYPLGSAPVPSAVAPKDAYQYEARSWSFAEGGVSIPPGARRIGDAWLAFGAISPKPSVPTTASLWASLAGVYPEMQDWVQRRGHGGARRWDDVTSPQEIAALKATSDVVVVQFHGGFQFQEAAGKSAVDIAKRAVDAGADVVIEHHPHVLQGLGFYKNKLIAFSLGNFVFDQNFASTFGSTMLRTVWEAGALVDAKLFPVEIVDYVPRLTAGRAARATLARIAERSLLDARADRDASGVRAFALTTPDGITPARVVIDGNAGHVLATAPASAARMLDLAANGASELDAGDLCEAHLDAAAAPRVLVGRDLLQWGHFEPEAAGAAPSTHWTTNGCDKDVRGGGGASGRGFFRLRRSATNTGSILARPVARIALTRHRTWLDASTPRDPDPTYTIRLAVRRNAGAKAFVRIDQYHFDDTDPTEDPDSAQVGSVRIDVPAPQDESSFEALELPVALPDGANMLLLYVGLEAGGAARALDFDDVRVIEWRPASGMPAGLGHFDLVKNGGDVPLRVGLLCQP